MVLSICLSCRVGHWLRYRQSLCNLARLSQLAFLGLSAELSWPWLGQLVPPVRKKESSKSNPWRAISFSLTKANRSSKRKLKSLESRVALAAVSFHPNGPNTEHTQSSPCVGIRILSKLELARSIETMAPAQFFHLRFHFKTALLFLLSFACLRLV